MTRLQRHLEQEVSLATNLQVKVLRAGRRLLPHGACPRPRRPDSFQIALALCLLLLCWPPGDRQQSSAGPRAGGALPASGPIGPKHVALVINDADPLSVSIGRLYQQYRAIPPQQVIRIRFPAGSSSLDPGQFSKLRREIFRRTPEQVQIYAVAWAAPWRVGCQSITAALSSGVQSLPCPPSCNTTRLNPFFARGDVMRPWQQLGIRPSMLLAATSVVKAEQLIKRGIAADGTAPNGTVYLLSTSDKARNGRALRYDLTRTILSPDLRVRILQADSLRFHNDVLAYFTGIARVQGISTNRFHPGAVADHLTSFGGLLTDSDSATAQTSSLRWLEAGASGSYGTVVEPCAILEKFPDPLLLLSYYRRGDTLIESYWRSVAMPDQGVFIGEPLARPWPFRGRM